MSHAETSPVIRFSDVRKAYGASRVLDGISLTVSSGEKIALMGPSGCGKTTLLRCINGLERIDGGQLIVNGVDLSGPTVDLNRFRAQVGMVFQQYNLFPHLSVLDNVMLGPVQVKKLSKAKARAKAVALLEQVGIADKAHVYPEQLSGGQKQRVAIARSLAMDPTVLLLDEPTSALDPPMSREVLSVIEQVQTGMTLLMVTHDLRFVSHMADRLIFLQAGRVVEDGPPGQVLEQPAHASTRQYLQAYH